MADCSLPLCPCEVFNAFSAGFLRVFCEFSAGFLRAKSGRLGMAAAVFVLGDRTLSRDG